MMLMRKEESPLLLHPQRVPLAALRMRATLFWEQQLRPSVLAHCSVLRNFGSVVMDVTANSDHNPFLFSTDPADKPGGMVPEEEVEGKLAAAEGRITDVRSVHLHAKPVICNLVFGSGHIGG